MHPLIILFAVVSGGALFGMAGTVLAVPVTAVALNVVAEARREVPVPRPHGTMVRTVDSPPAPAPVPPSPPPRSSGLAVLVPSVGPRLLNESTTPTPSSGGGNTERARVREGGVQ